MLRIKRTTASRKRVEATPARVAAKGEREAKRYAGAFARVRLVRAWIAALAALVAVLYSYVALLERVVRWWSSSLHARLPTRMATALGTRSQHFRSWSSVSSQFVARQVARECDKLRLAHFGACVSAWARASRLSKAYGRVRAKGGRVDRGDTDVRHVVLHPSPPSAMPRLVLQLGRRSRARPARAARAIGHTLAVLALVTPRAFLAETPTPGATRTPLAAMATVSLTHDGGGTASVNTNTASSTTFTLTSLSVSDITVNLVVSVCSGALATGNCTRSPTSVFLPSLTSTTITVNFTGGAAAGTGTITLRANNTSGTQLAASSVTVTVNAAPSGPTVSTTPHRGDAIDVSQCIANCFESTFSYSTPAYISLDMPRSVTLLYRSGRAKPMGRLSLYVTDANTAVTSFRLQLTDPNGSYQAFSNDSTSLFFAKNPAGATWIVAEFDASAIPTSAKQYTAYLTSYSGSTQGVTGSVAVRIIVVNDQTSPLGAGVDIVGLQRLYSANQTGGVLVTDGTGSASFFSGSCAPMSACTFTSPGGDFSTLTTGSNQYTRTYPEGTIVTFDAAGKQLSVKSRFGDSTTVTWGTNAAGVAMPTRFTDPVGQTIDLNFYGVMPPNSNQTGSLANIVSQGARVAWFGVWGGVYNGTLLHLIDVDGNWYGAANYDAQRRLTKWYSNQLSDTTNYEYSYGKTLRYVDAPSVVVDGSSSPVRPRTQMREAWAQLLDSAAAGTGTSTTPLAVPADPRAVVVGPRNDSTFFSLNRFGAPRKTYAPLTPSDSVEYNETTGQVTRTISPTGIDVQYTWSAHKLVKVRNVTLSTQDSIEYDTQYALPTHVISSSSAEQWLAYDHTRAGWPLQTTRLGPSGGTPTTHYADSRGRDTAVVDPVSHTTKWYFSATGLQNMDSVRAPNLQVSRVGRDGFGRVVSTRDPYGARDSTQLDVLNRPTWVAGPLSNDTTRYTYDLLNNVTSVADAKNQVYTYQRNALGWVTKLTHPSTLGSDSTAYDIAGNPVYARTRQNRQVALEYDLLGRVTKKRSLTSNDSVTFAYDLSGRRVVAKSFVGGSTLVSTDTIVTDSLGRTVMETTARPGSSSAWYVASYYGATDPGRAYVQAYKYGSPTVEAGANYYYDAVKRLSTIAPRGGPTTRLSYNAEQLRDTIVFPSGLRETWQYTSSHALSKREYSVTALSDSLTRAYRTDSLARLVERASGANGTFQLFDYDIKGRLAYWQKKHQTPDTSCTNLGGWGYDCSGSSTTLDQLVTATYDQVENPADPGTTLDPGNRLRAFNGVSMTYDADGNLVRRVVGAVTDSLDWDDFGQLRKVIRAGTAIVTFDYDGFGRRIQKRTASDTVQYVWDGDQLLLEATGSGTTLRAYTYYPGIDRLHSVSTPTQTYYASVEPATGDVNGVIRASDNALVARYAYTPWGELETAPQAFDSVSSLRWKGLLYDAETGLYYMRARYYDPKLRRFLSEDPSGLEGGINIFAFAGGDPINRSDPTGLDDCKWVNYPGAYVMTYDVYNGNHAIWTDPPRMAYECQEQTAHRYDDPAARGSPATGQTTGGAEASLRGFELNAFKFTPPNTPFKGCDPAISPSGGGTAGGETAVWDGTFTLRSWLPEMQYNGFRRIIGIYTGHIALRTSPQPGVLGFPTRSFKVVGTANCQSGAATFYSANLNLW
jgi:RHS repeat-associated protein